MNDLTSASRFQDDEQRIRVSSRRLRTERRSGLMSGRSVLLLASLIVIATALPVRAHHSFAAEYDRGQTDHADRHSDQARMDQSARSNLHRRQGRQGERRQLGFRARPAQRFDATRMEQEFATSGTRRHHRWLPVQVGPSRCQRQDRQTCRRPPGIRGVLVRCRPGAGRALRQSS